LWDESHFVGRLAEAEPPFIRDGQNSAGRGRMGRKLVF